METLKYFNDCVKGEFDVILAIVPKVLSYIYNFFILTTFISILLQFSLWGKKS